MAAQWECQVIAIAELRGHVVGTQYRELDRDMGYQSRRILSRDELVDLFPTSGVEDITPGDRRSFF